MYEYAGGCVPRNKKLEMANHSTPIYDGAGLYNELVGIPIDKVNPILIPVPICL